jgi:siderophore (surfactin) biosynthesis regulatory protein
MPIFKEIISEQTQILIWKYSDEEEFSADLISDEKEFENLKQKSPKRLIEKQMVRHMLRKILPNHKIRYHENGQPYLEPFDKFVSVSHSFPYAVLAISEKKIGVDIEQVKDRIDKIKLKFLHPKEIDWLGRVESEIEHLTAIWCIKEALFKIHSSKQWSFKEFYVVDEFLLDKFSKIKCKVFDKDREDKFLAHLEKIENYYLAITEEE